MVLRSCRSAASRKRMVQGKVSDSEGEFLHVGNRLLEFHQRSSAIVESARATAEATAGAEVTAAREGLSRLVERLRRCFTEADCRQRRTEAASTQILRGLAHVGSALMAFNKIVRMLRILGITTNIENARLLAVESGFDTLAANVRELSSRIESKLEAIDDEKSKLARKLSVALVSQRNLERRRRLSAHEVLTRTETSLDGLERTHDRGAEAARIVAGSSAEVSERLSEIVQSMQFHDITRQEMEHARDTLRRLSEDEDSGATSDDDGVAAGAALQAAQIEASTGKLLDAIQQLMRSLHQVAVAAAELSNRTRAVLGVLDEAGQSFLTCLSRELAPVLTMLAEDAETARAVAETMRGVSASGADMARFATEIEAIGTEIHFVALNTSVKAAHTGEQGAGLGVLAEEIARLSENARSWTREMAARFREVVDEAARLRDEFQSGDVATDPAAEVEAIERELAGLLDKLGALNEQVSERIRLMDRSVSILTTDVESTLEGISIHHRVEDTAAQVLGDLAPLVAAAPATLKLVGRVPARAPATVAAATGSEVPLPSSHLYTTDGERAVHQSLIGNSEAASVEADMTPPSGAEYGLGDNVELF